MFLKKCNGPGADLEEMPGGSRFYPAECLEPPGGYGHCTAKLI